MPQASISSPAHTTSGTLMRGHRRSTSTRSGQSLRGAYLLSIIPVFVLFYIVLILPFMGGGGQPRIENILFWPILAGIVLALALANLARLDKGYFLTLPIASLLVFMMFAGASIGWALSPDFAFSRYTLQLLIVIAVVVPYALPVNTTHTLHRLHAICLATIALNAYFVLTTPATAIGHSGYFLHKQGLGMMCGITLVVAAHEFLVGGWRRLLALVTISITSYVIIASQSKSPLAFLLVAVVCAGPMLLVCKWLRTTPAFVVGAIVLASFAMTNPIGKMSHRIYGDPTLTGRTFIWDFINYWVSQRSWFGWGFHSYWGVPNSPHNFAPGFIKDMISTHSGYLELRLDTGYVGYWIFLVFVYASLHVLEQVRRKDPLRAWAYLSIVLYVVLQNLVESIWVYPDPLWIIFLIVIAEAVRISRTGNPDQRTVRASATEFKRGRNMSVRGFRGLRSAG